MEILARAVGRRKEAVAQIQITSGTGEFIINNKSAQEYLHNNSCSLISIKAPFDILQKNETDSIGNLSSKFNFERFDTIVKVKGGGLVGQAEAIKLGVARAICELESAEANSSDNSLSGGALNNIEEGLESEVRKQFKSKGYLTQDSRVKERRKYGLKKARKASQYNKR